MQQSNITLHFSSDPVLHYRFKKIKVISSLLKINLTQSPKELFTDLQNLSPIPILPIIQDSENKVNIAGSNPIIRYLATISKDHNLYGGQDIFKKSLIDQWLDYDTCELETLALAVELFISGRQVDLETVLKDSEKALMGLNKRLKQKKFLVGDQLSIADIVLAISVSPLLVNLFNQLQRKKFTHIVNWFLGISQKLKQIEPKKFQAKANNKVQKWKNKGKKDDANAKDTKDKKQKKGKPQKADKSKKAQKQKDNKKEQTKKQETGDDLFDDDDSAPPAPAPKPVIKKPQKKKATAKSIVILDVKVYEQEQDLLQLFQKIKKQIVLDGLVWNQQPKIEPVAFGMNKLQIGCVVQDEKVSIQDDICEKLREWEDEIQSVDTVSFQKL